MLLVGSPTPSLLGDSFPYMEVSGLSLLAIGPPIEEREQLENFLLFDFNSLNPATNLSDPLVECTQCTASQRELFGCC